MPGISKTIEEIKELNNARTQGDWDYDSDDYQTATIFSDDTTSRGGIVIDSATWENIADGMGGDSGGSGEPLPDVQFIVLACNSIIPIITAYEQSQKEVRQAEDILVESVKLYNKSQAELDTANRRIAELENINIDEHFRGGR